MLDNPRQERFCRLYLKHGIAWKAYRDAYQLSNAQKATAEVNSTRLKKMGAIKTRLAELAAEAIEISDLTLDVVVRGIAKEAATAKSSRDRLTAWGKLADLLGFSTNRVEITSTQAGDSKLIDQLVKLGVPREHAQAQLGYKTDTTSPAQDSDGSLKYAPHLDS